MIIRPAARWPFSIAFLLGVMSFGGQGLGQEILSPCESTRIDGRVVTDNDRDGVHLGNGGDILVKVENGAVTKGILMDFYEAEELRGITHDLGGADLGVSAKLEIAFQRWSRLDEGRADQYRSWLGQFETEACFKRNINLRDLDDSEHQFLPNEPGWEIRQIAIQQEPMFPEDPRYIIDQNLWDLLDNDGRAGLILHELVYRDAVHFGVNNSRGVRYLTSAFTSGYTDSWDINTYLDRIKRVGIETAYIGGLWVDLSERDPTFHENGVLELAFAKAGAVYESPFGELHLKCLVMFDDTGYLQGFTLDAAYDLPELTIGSHKIRVSSRARPGTPCREIPNLPWGDIPFDFYSDNPKDMDNSYVVVNTSDVFELRGEHYLAVYGGYMAFSNGRVTEAMIGPGWAREDPFVVLNGEECKFDAGVAMFDYHTGAPGCGYIQACNLPVKGSEGAWFKGHSCWSVDPDGYSVSFGQLINDTEINLHRDNPDKATFAEGTTLYLFNGGRVRSGTLALDAQLMTTDNTLVRIPGNSYLVLDVDGRVEEFSPR